MTVTLNFKENVDNIIEYFTNIKNKIENLAEFLFCLELFSDYLLNSPNNHINFADLELSTLINKLNVIIKKIEINNCLPNITNNILEFHTFLNDAVAICVLNKIRQSEIEQNQKHTNILTIFKKKLTPITLSGLASLRHSIMFTKFNIHINPILNNYSNSVHNWYMTNYRIPKIINNIKNSEKQSLIAMLELQLTITMKIIETFKYNYQSKTLLTKNDYEELSKLLYQTNMISSILERVAPSLQNISNSLEETMKFALYRISTETEYLKKHKNFTNRPIFFQRKKSIEIASLKAMLLAAASIKDLKLISARLLSHFSKIKKIGYTYDLNNPFQITASTQ